MVEIIFQIKMVRFKYFQYKIFPQNIKISNHIPSQINVHCLGNFYNPLFYSIAVFLCTSVFSSENEIPKTFRKSTLEKNDTKMAIEILNQ